jgi:membrane protein implicated in regulation of membrane protease activity
MPIDLTQWWIIDIIAPAILLIVLIWLVVRVRSNRDDRENRRAEEGTRDLYREEEQRRREGTDTAEK